MAATKVTFTDFYLARKTKSKKYVTGKGAIINQVYEKLRRKIKLIFASYTG